MVERTVADLQAFARNVTFGEKVCASAPEERILSIFNASYEYLDDERQVGSTSVNYTAEDRYDAISSSIKFWVGRQQALSERSNKLLCVKVASVNIGPFGSTGSLFNPGNWPFFEWKVDTAGVPLEIHALMKIDEMSNWEKRRSRR
jgi:hypothetical protein